jgi:hypothetical protein
MGAARTCLFLLQRLWEQRPAPLVVAAELDGVRQDIHRPAHTTMVERRKSSSDHRLLVRAHQAAEPDVQRCKLLAKHPPPAYRCEKWPPRVREKRRAPKKATSGVWEEGSEGAGTWIPLCAWSDGEGSLLAKACDQQFRNSEKAILGICLDRLLEMYFEEY